MKQGLLFIVLLTGAALLVLSGCSNNTDSTYGSGGSPGGGGGGTPPNTIVMQNLAFSPSSKTITKGTTLTFQNKDGFTHTATSDASGGWDTGDVAGGASKSVTFSTAGTFTYHCKYHSSMGMTGTIIVQ